jgi:hypothetical protein
MIEGYLKQPPQVGAMDPQCFVCIELFCRWPKAPEACHRGLGRRNEVGRPTKDEVEGYKPHVLLLLEIGGHHIAIDTCRCFI